MIRAFNNEYLRRLSEELDKQKTKFRSVPVPKTIKSDGRQAMETQVRVKHARVHHCGHHGGEARAREVLRH